MKVKQLSIFLENQSGRLSEVLSAIGNEGINIRALSLADTSGFGILRLIVNDIDKARRILQNAGFTVRETDVIAVEIPDKPGGLAKVLAALATRSINIEYMYAFVEKASNNAVVIFRIENLDEAIETLKSHGVEILTAQEVYSL
ncbi:MAG: ACT domain-containing protein [Armatimonadota bacterium]